MHGKSTIRVDLLLCSAGPRQLSAHRNDPSQSTPGTTGKKEIECMAEGTVKWFSEKKGYGFISQDDGKDIFVHYSSIVMPGFKKLSEGDRVSFEVEEDNRGPKAKNVQRL
jgi:cold shock protein